MSSIMRFIVGESFFLSSKDHDTTVLASNVERRARSGEKGKGQKIFWAARPLEEAAKRTQATNVYVLRVRGY